MFKLFYLSIKKKIKITKNEVLNVYMKKKTKKTNPTGYLSEMTKGKETLKLQNITTQKNLSAWRTGTWEESICTRHEGFSCTWGTLNYFINVSVL